ncbi:MAG: NADH-quinone oxidoreductase subunit C [Deltaproteobacteria bacterium]|nr:NADH-quinone oxidoreductase subunit C [Deltaproteobacteria bacterium]
MTTLNNTITSTLGTDAIQDNSQHPVNVSAYQIPRERFAEIAKAIKIAGARLVAEWATDESPLGRGFGIYACYAKDSEYLIVKTYAPLEDPTFPSLTKKFVSAYRFERQMRSLMGVVPVGHPDPRPWIKHEDWPEGAYPLRKTFDASKAMPRVKGEYRFIKAEGEGVYEIPVGPVHAGIIERSEKI